MGERSQQFRHAGVEDITSILASRDRVRGDFHVAGGLRIDGVLHGNVEPSGPDSVVIVARGAYVEGRIRALCVRIEGHVKGPLRVDGHIDIAASAEIEGDIEYGSIAIEAGASVTGRLARDRGESDMA